MGPVPSSSGRRYRLPRPMGGTCDWFAATTWTARSRVGMIQDMSQTSSENNVLRVRAQPTGCLFFEDGMSRRSQKPPGCRRKVA